MSDWGIKVGEIHSEEPFYTSKKPTLKIATDRSHPHALRGYVDPGVLPVGLHNLLDIPHEYGYPPASLCAIGFWSSGATPPEDLPNNQPIYVTPIGTQQFAIDAYTNSTSFKLDIDVNSETEIQRLYYRYYIFDRNGT